MKLSTAVTLGFVGWALLIFALIYYESAKRYDKQITSVTKGLNCELSGGVALRADVDGYMSVIACLNKEAIK